VADAPPKKGKGLKGNRTYILIGAGLAAAYVLYRYEKNKSSSSSTTAASTSTACTCDDGSTPDATTGLCADGTTCGAAGSVSGAGTAGAAGSGATGTPGSPGQGSPCILSTGLPGVVDFSGNCVAVSGTNPPAGKGPVTKKPVTSCPKGQRLVNGACTASCPPGYERLTAKSNCTKKKLTKKKSTKTPPVKGVGDVPGYSQQQTAATTNRPAGGGSLVHPNT